MLSSVRLSARLSVTRVYHTKTVEVRIMECLPYGSPIPLVFAGYVSSRNSKGSPEWDVKQGRGGKTSHFLALKVNISKTVRDTSRPKLLLMTNRKLYMLFRLTPTSMTLNDLELL